ncbi:MAG: hypothetical protein R3B91_11065 [Planctomycetaceae bacterium]
MAVQRDGERSGRDWSGSEAAPPSRMAHCSICMCAAPTFVITAVKPAIIRKPDSQDCQSSHQPAAYSDGKRDDGPNEHEQ